jgi:hypothetical protein
MHNDEQRSTVATVDVAARLACSALVRKLVAGQISGDQFESAMGSVANSGAGGVLAWLASLLRGLASASCDCARASEDIGEIGAIPARSY